MIASIHISALGCLNFSVELTLQKQDSSPLQHWSSKLVIMVHGSPIPLTGLIQDRKNHILHVQLSFYLSESYTETHRISAHLHISLVTPGGDWYKAFAS